MKSEKADEDFLGDRLSGHIVIFTLALAVAIGELHQVVHVERVGKVLTDSENFFWTLELELEVVGLMDRQKKAVYVTGRCLGWLS